MGKVASKSIAAALQPLQDVEVFHLHYFSPVVNEGVRKKYSKVNAATDFSYLDEAEILRQTLTNQHIPLNIITLVREPIARNISAFFENLIIFQENGIALSPQSTRDLIGKFQHAYPHQIPLKWFDTEFEPATGIDIYQFPFPIEKRQCSIEHNSHRVLVLRSDLPNPEKATAIEHAFKLPQLSIPQKNTAQNKPYADSYQKFLQTIQLPDAYIEEMLNSKYCKHFFSKDERSQISDRWKTNN